jgi:hypothetical protein
MLARALAMQAQLAPTLEARRERCVQGAAMAEALVHMGVDAANAAARARAHAALPREQQASTPLDALPIDPAKLLLQPESLLALATYDVSAGVLEGLRAAAADPEYRAYVPCARRAALSLHHLLWLCGALEDAGLQLHAAAVLTALQLLCELAPPPASPFLPLLARARRARALSTLGYHDRALALLSQGTAAAQAAGKTLTLGLGLDTETAQLYLGDVAERERRLATAGPASLLASASASGSNAGASAATARPGEEWSVRGLEVRHLWAHLAGEALALGQLRAASEYLTAAARHNRAYEDGRNAALCARLRARVDAAEGRADAALAHLLLSLKEVGNTGDPLEWAATVAQAADMLVALGDVQQVRCLVALCVGWIVDRVEACWKPWVGGEDLN